MTARVLAALVASSVRRRPTLHTLPLSPLLSPCLWHVTGARGRTSLWRRYEAPDKGEFRVTRSGEGESIVLMYRQCVWHDFFFPLFWMADATDCENVYILLFWVYLTLAQGITTGIICQRIYRESTAVELRYSNSAIVL